MKHISYNFWVRIKQQNLNDILKISAENAKKVKSEAKILKLFYTGLKKAIS